MNELVFKGQNDQVLTNSVKEFIMTMFPSCVGNIEFRENDYGKYMLYEDGTIYNQLTLANALIEYAWVYDFDKATEAYKTRVGSTLRKGGSVAMHGEGTYAVGKVSPRKYYAKDGSISSVRFAKKVVRYKSYGDNKQKFIPDQALSDRLN